MITMTQVQVQRLLMVLILFLHLPPSTSKTYPSYCSTKDDQLTRQLPALNLSTKLQQNTNSVTIKHVTTIIRHGSRTPYAPHNCWEGYTDPSADTSTWTCSLTSMTRPQSTEAVNYEYLVNGVSDQIIRLSGKGQFFSFDKLYDANWSNDHPDHYPENVANDLRGNCQKGQLILKGHAQQVNNGHALLAAYVKHDDYTSPTVGPLLNFMNEARITVVGERAYDEPRLYFRSDDDERTMMSGMILLESLYGNLMKLHERHYEAEGLDVKANGVAVPVIPVHTSDRDKDILAPNPTACPRLVELEVEAIGSPGYQEKFVRSDEAQLMKTLRMEEFGGMEKMQDADEAVDCVMTTVCEDKTLPYVLDEALSGEDPDVVEKYGKDLFQRFVDFNIARVAYVYNHKAGAFSKLSTNPLWNDILSGLLVHTNADEYEMRQAWPDLRPKSKFALYSAHDTTLMSLLASLGPNVYSGQWPPYASMVNIELYDIEWKTNADQELKDFYPTGIGFRLLYNGEMITDHISGCKKGEDICDIDLLVLHVYPFANVTEWGDQCKLKNPIGTGDRTDNILDHRKGRHSHNGGANVVLILMGAILCVVCGAFVTFLYMTKFIVPKQQQEYHHRPVPLSHDEHSLELTKTQISDDVGGNANGIIYGLPSQQEHRDII